MSGSTKFQFGGHERPFWSRDVPGRVKVTIELEDGFEHDRRDTFYVQGSTVGQVAAAVEQALFVPEDEDKSCKRGPRLDEVTLSVSGSGVYFLRPELTPEALPALRQIVGQLERQAVKAEADRQAYREGCQRYQKEAQPGKGGSREGPARDYPEGAISPGE